MAEPIDIRVMLDDQDFRAIVSGGIVRVGMRIRGSDAVVQIALKDIGWASMTEALRDAIDGHAVAEPFTPAEEFFAGMAGAGDGAEEEDDDGTQARD